MNKIIGLTASNNIAEEDNYINTAYVDAFTTALNTTPIVIPSYPSPKKFTEAMHETELFVLKSNAEAVVDKLDALVITGGVDINPTTFADKVNNCSSGCDFRRDFYEAQLIARALARRIPILGICRGFQLLGQMLKIPTWHQDITHFNECHNTGSHDMDSRTERAHWVRLFGPFAEFVNGYYKMDKSMMGVNSFHHQGFSIFDELENYLFKNEDPNHIKRKNLEFMPGYFPVDILACTEKIIEAFEVPDKKIFAVQWHPEEMGADSATLQYFFQRYLA